MQTPAEVLLNFRFTIRPGESLGMTPLKYSLAQLRVTQSSGDPYVGALITRYSFAGGGLPICGVAPGSIAHRAGLKDDDVIIGVNGDDFRDASKAEIVQEFSGKSSFVLNISRIYTIPIAITKDARGFGFTPCKYSMTEIQNMPANIRSEIEKLCGTFAIFGGGLAICETVDGGAASRGGLRPWDVMLEINGTNIRAFPQEEIFKFFKKSDQINCMVYRRGLQPPPQTQIPVNPTAFQQPQVLQPPPTNAAAAAAAAPFKVTAHLVTGQAPAKAAPVHSPQQQKAPAPAVSKRTSVGGRVEVPLVLKRANGSQWGLVPSVLDKDPFIGCAVITDVLPKSNAEACGLRKGDIIASIDDHRLFRRANIKIIASLLDKTEHRITVLRSASAIADEEKKKKLMNPLFDPSIVSRQGPAAAIPAPQYLPPSPPQQQQQQQQQQANPQSFIETRRIPLDYDSLPPRNNNSNNLMNAPQSAIETLQTPIVMTPPPPQPPSPPTHPVVIPASAVETVKNPIGLPPPTVKAPPVPHDEHANNPCFLGPSAMVGPEHGDWTKRPIPPMSPDKPIEPKPEKVAFAEFQMFNSSVHSPLMPVSGPSIVAPQIPHIASNDHADHHQQRQFSAFASLSSGHLAELIKIDESSSLVTHHNRKRLLPMTPEYSFNSSPSSPPTSLETQFAEEEDDAITAVSDQDIVDLATKFGTAVAPI